MNNTEQHVDIENNKVYCNICGKEFDIWDAQEGTAFDHWFGYGSLFDLLHLKFNLCCDCTDKIISEIILNLKTIDVAEEYEIFENSTNKISLEEVKNIAEKVKQSYTNNK